jgi:hypothetical protein
MWTIYPHINQFSAGQASPPGEAREYPSNPGHAMDFTQDCLLGAPSENRAVIPRLCPVAFSGANRFNRRRARLSSKIGTP